MPESRYKVVGVEVPQEVDYVVDLIAQFQARAVADPEGASDWMKGRSWGDRAVLSVVSARFSHHLSTMTGARAN